MSNLSRLSDLNITDDILRAHFYQIVMAYVRDLTSEEVKEHTILLDEEYRADLISQRVYATVDLSWLVYLVCEIDDPAEPLPVGETIVLPQAAWIRRTMRQFMDDLGL